MGTRLVGSENTRSCTSLPRGRSGIGRVIRAREKLRSEHYEEPKGYENVGKTERMREEHE